ncbi:spore protease YyaC [Blautia liquoris]|uniref:Spore protease YyaC n=1 Tax=Blautia liquoris TaxID=2779518 RepID=A0A7M2RG25_9FIRM|nr:spore protease YyaC [Blautia liquoris]QOV18961.1 spore protease YyaC [Blautia liquoris]
MGQIGAAMFRKTKNETCYVNADSIHASTEIGNALEYYISHMNFSWNDLIFLCIGSDRITGDCLGPLTGSQLNQKGIHPYTVYGTLDDPVHALNLTDVINDIQYAHPQALIIAIDASLGSTTHQGCICVGEGAILPGAGVSKDLPAVGHIFITGIVNQTGISPHLLLSSTRLSDVMRMADSISGGILGSYYIRQLAKKRIPSISGKCFC